jgi:formylglycine-generating enzyme required for sulfatase activity
MAFIDSVRFRFFPRGLGTVAAVLLLVLCIGAAAGAPALDNRSTAPDGSTMILVNGGSFAMGDVFSEGDENELPVHQVTLDPYYLADAEITWPA